MASGTRQAVAFNSFLEAAILVGIFEKMPTKIAASKEKNQTYLLPSLKTKNHSLMAMVCNFDAIRLSYRIEVTNLDDPKFRTARF